MKRLLIFSRLRVMGLVAMVLACTASASAATVKCSVHAPWGRYVAYLFRVGDRYPIATTKPFDIDGGKVVAFTGVHGGNYFIRVSQVDGPYLTGQSKDDWLWFYYSTPLNLGDIYIRP